ncbi:protein IQ-DOMAIN 1-like [Triticum dicoccoides]|uniref:protein IQ-DOMAIN 1-like n=1 Tax=Triticum dicoccoides TaxID=85692 RepID=UPI00188E0BE5|nr:protein IQ-DOMAIN 1-like [Triticum dicoccoides]
MGKWIKSLVGLKAPSASAAPGKGRKWSRLWRSGSSSASRDGAGGCEASSTTSSASGIGSVVAAVARAPPRDFRVIRQEWAAIRIQAAFRALLARRALKALRGIVRLQALVRGRLVRRQLAVTLSRMEALLRVQERAMERRARCSADAQSQDAPGDRNGRADPLRETEERWCDRQGSVNQVKSRMHMKHEGAVKRQRAIAYAHSHQGRSSRYSGRSSSPASSLRNHESYIEGWMATKPWESTHMESNLGESRRLHSYKEKMNFEDSKYSCAGSIKIRRNNDSTRVEAMPPPALSASSSDFGCDESSPSTSSVTPGYSTNTLASEARSDSGAGPGYMSLTKAAKARLEYVGGSRRGPFQLQRQRSGGVPYYSRRVALSSLDSESNAGSDVSAAARRLNSLSLKGQSMTRSLDKENYNC